MHPILNKYDDFVVVSNDLTNDASFTLTALVHNELHFLGPFLEHYRKLGVRRFVLLNDRSTDGSLEFLCNQPDVMVVQSKRKFGDKVSSEDASALELPHQRVDLVWRMLLLEKYTLGKWSLHLDVDEFLELPEGVSIDDFTASLGDEDGNVIWSVMIDMYPKTLTALKAMEQDEVVDLSKSWYFDGRKHLRLRKNGEPLTQYPGCRARLLAKFGLTRKRKPLKYALKRILGMHPPSQNCIRKPVLLRWFSGCRFNSSHSVNARGSITYLLPLRHYKFNGPIHARITRALTTAGYPDGGGEYGRLQRLLSAMSERDENFCDSKSVQFTGFDDFKRTGNAVGFD
ncbi:glycosyltransferase family 2 protein [Yoonia maritima]|uniref:glycosyltransferase family 2 protein n=1 Tax=Yoonia maritima TaxID=1435347 RepID=UPI003734C3A2